MARRWAPGDLYIIEQLALWYTAEEIGRFMDRSKHGVRAYYYRHGRVFHWQQDYVSADGTRHQARLWTPAEWHCALKLSEKHTIEEVARQLGRSRAAVWQKFRENGLRFGGNRWYTATFVAELCGCSVPWVGRVARQFELPTTGGSASGKRYRLQAKHVRKLVRAIRPGRLYLCEDL
jgi:hypothetical protein